jgi:hypothetical protein
MLTGNKSSAIQATRDIAALSLRDSFRGIRKRRQFLDVAGVVLDDDGRLEI